MKKEKVVCYIGTMFIQVKHSTKNPEAFPDTIANKSTLLQLVIQGNFKFIDGSSPLKRQNCPKKRIERWNFILYNQLSSVASNDKQMLHTVTHRSIP